MEPRLSSARNYGSRSVEWWDPKLRNPYVLNFNASVQYEFAKNYLLELSYQGSSGVGLIERWQYNTFPIDYFAGNPAQQTAVFAAAQNYRPFPQFGDIRFRSNFGHSTFHSGTVKLEKRMSRGLYFSTFYTYSKAIDSQDGDNDGSGVAPIQNRGLEKARAGFDRTHRFIGVVNYELPFGQGQAVGDERLAEAGARRLRAVLDPDAGERQPVHLQLCRQPVQLLSRLRRQRPAGHRGTDSIRDDWYDLGGDRFNTGNINSVYSRAATTAWPTSPFPAAARPRSRPGSIARNAISASATRDETSSTGLPLRWTQVSAQKNFQIKERYKVQLRWDMQNVFKTYNFNTPTTHGGLPQPVAIRQGVERSHHGFARRAAADEPDPDGAVLAPCPAGQLGDCQSDCQSAPAPAVTYLLNF